MRQLEAINPYLTYETYTERVVPSNVERLFSECDVVVEAFDKPDQKAMLLENLLTRLPEKPVVSSSGMAGYGSANLIKTEKRFGHVYLCGDGTSDVADGLGPMAPRVAVLGTRGNPWCCVCSSEKQSRNSNKGETDRVRPSHGYVIIPWADPGTPQVRT